MLKWTYISIVILFASIASVAHAEWDDQCVSDCFRTHHDCHYCDYQCTVDSTPSERAHVSDFPCPLENYWRDKSGG